jgi:polyribonucleotide nucleotidyltransferase
MITYGDTAALVTATASARPRDGIDFFPLSLISRKGFIPWGESPEAFFAARADLLKERF